VNPEGIRIDWGSRIRAHARLECIRQGDDLGRIEMGEGVVIEYYFHASAAERITIANGVLT